MYRYSVLVVLLISSLFFITGCEKENENPLEQELFQEELETQDPFINAEEILNFFSDDFLARKNRFRSRPQFGRSADQVSDLIDVIQDDLSKDDQSLMNVQALINSLGYIDWTSYLHFQDESGDQISFPVYKENSPKVNGVFMFYVSGENVKYHLTHRGKINSHLNNDDWRSEYPNLYFSVYDLWDYDLRIFDKENNRLLRWLNENNPNDNNARITSTGRTIECYTVWRCGSCPPVNQVARNEDVSTRDWLECCSPTTYCDTYGPDIPPIGSGGNGGTGNGNGGGSTGGGNDDPSNISFYNVNDILLHDPCFQLEYWKIYFKNTLSELNQKLNYSYEVGYNYPTDSNGAFSKESLSGENNPQNTIAINIISKTTGIIHTHPNSTSASSCFSGDDVGAMFDLFNLGAMENPSSFFMGLVSNAGGYMMYIENVNTFSGFANNFDLNIFNATVNQVYLLIRPLVGEEKAREIALVSGLDGTGIKLYKSDTTFSEWDELRNNTNNTNNSKVPCND